MEIGNRLKNARVEMGLTQEQVAEEIGVSRQTVYNWENSKCYPDIVNVIKLSDLYSVSLDELLKEDKNMIRHLKEATDTVTSRKKLTKLIITLIYWGFWALMILGYWILRFTTSFERAAELLPFVGNMNEVDINYIFSVPFTLVIMAFVGLNEDFGKLKWIYIPITGAAFMLYQTLTTELVWYIGNVLYAWEVAGHKTLINPFEVFKWYFVDQNWFLALALGLGVSALGLWIGTFIRYYRKSKTEKETE